MQVSTLFAYSSIASLSAAFTIPALWARQSSQSVTSDTGTVQIEVPASTDSTSDFGGEEDAATAIGEVISTVIQMVQGMADNDVQRRQAFTQNVAAQARSSTGQNVIVSNVDYSLDPEDQTVVSTDYDSSVGSDVSFDVIAFKTGTFSLEGDGGFENWAYVVDGTCTVVGKTITC